MSPRFTDDDVDKPVESTAGELIGTVASIEDDAVLVRPSPGVLDSIRARLGWKRAREDAIVIHEDAVVEASEGVLVLETEPPDRPEFADGVESESAPTTDRPSSTETATDSTPESLETGETDADGRFEAGSGRRVEPTDAEATGETEIPPVGEEPSEVDEADRADRDRPGVADPELIEAIDEQRDEDEGRDDGERRDGGETESEMAGSTGTESPTEEEAGADTRLGVREESPDGVDDGHRVDSSSVSDEGADASDVGVEATTAGGTHETERSASIDSGPDVEAPEETGGIEEDTGGESESEGADLTDELGRDVATDPDEMPGTEIGADSDRSPATPADEDAAEHVDAGVDLEGAIDATEADVDSDPLERRSSAVGETETEATSAEASADSGAAVAIEHRPGTASERYVVDQLVDVEPRSGRERKSDREGRLAGAQEGASERAKATRERSTGAEIAMLEPQRIAFEQGLAIQRRSIRLTGSALETQATVQRRTLEAAALAASAPLSATASTVESALPRERTRVRDRSGDDGGSNREPRLELVDGIDSMYRSRLEEAGITSLDDLAAADVETVADAAEVTEKRAIDWIERVDG
ncbi:helix-hairpin-helix domain-containing protein [Natrarchaeobius oligotrophus]|uniref:Helix-hairpin-helix domain-containing protein n=1 Tax=Natrarchaeobius chitinivorans TaxID=1679083 RepID=A0A3N6PEX8_NATCH|nr:helix-hairpin-helix domain-containing protein [Natrarchaeobius chitinivorans]RQG98429.1 hypothetical protein EA472_17575 [Natrarchaeobius chitinivorans]